MWKKFLEYISTRTLQFSTVQLLNKKELNKLLLILISTHLHERRLSQVPGVWERQSTSTNKVICFASFMKAYIPYCIIHC